MSKELGLEQACGHEHELTLESECKVPFLGNGESMGVRVSMRVSMSMRMGMMVSKKKSASEHEQRAWA
jgi:hypothetical protein